MILGFRGAWGSGFRVGAGGGGIPKQGRLYLRRMCFNDQGLGLRTYGSGSP